MLRRAIVTTVKSVTPCGARTIPRAYFSRNRGLTPFGFDFPNFHRSLSTPNDIFRMFDNLDSFPSQLGFSRLNHLPMDVKETKTHYEVKVDLPGVKKSDVHISIRNNELTISAERVGEKKEEGENFHRVERHHGHVSRTFVLPDNADHEKIEANFEHGVLELSIAKHEGPQKEEVRKIAIK